MCFVTELDWTFLITRISLSSFQRIASVNNATHLQFITMRKLAFLLLSLCHAVTTTNDDIIKVCRGEEITVDLSDPLAKRPKVYSLDTSMDALPSTVSLNRRTGVMNGLVRDAGFRNVYKIGVIGTDPVNQQSARAVTMIQVDWCQGTRVSRFYLVDTKTDSVLRVLNDGDTVNLGCLGGFGVEAETFAEIATEAQSEGELTHKVKFVLDGRGIRTESAFPYTLGGDNAGDYFPFLISAGEHRLKAIPYNSNGEQGVPKEIVFTVVK